MCFYNIELVLIVVFDVISNCYYTIYIAIFDSKAQYKFLYICIEFIILQYSFSWTLDF